MAAARSRLRGAADGTRAIVIAPTGGTVTRLHRATDWNTRNDGPDAPYPGRRRIAANAQVERREDAS
jgi:hypothetical protein